MEAATVIISKTEGKPLPEKIYIRYEEVTAVDFFSRGGEYIVYNLHNFIKCLAYLYFIETGQKIEFNRDDKDKYICRTDKDGKPIRAEIINEKGRIISLHCAQKYAFGVEAESLTDVLPHLPYFDLNEPQNAEQAEVTVDWLIGYISEIKKLNILLSPHEILNVGLGISFLALMKPEISHKEISFERPSQEIIDRAKDYYERRKIAGTDKNKLKKFHDYETPLLAIAAIGRKVIPYTSSIFTDMFRSEKGEARAFKGGFKYHDKNYFNGHEHDGSFVGIDMNSAYISVFSGKVPGQHIARTYNCEHSEGKDLYKAKLEEINRELSGEKNKIKREKILAKVQKFIRDENSADGVRAYMGTGRTAFCFIRVYQAQVKNGKIPVLTETFGRQTKNIEKVFSFQGKGIYISIEELLLAEENYSNLNYQIIFSDYYQLKKIKELEYFSNALFEETEKWKRGTWQRTRYKRMAVTIYGMLAPRPEVRECELIIDNEGNSRIKIRETLTKRPDFISIAAYTSSKIRFSICREAGKRGRAIYINTDGIIYRKKPSDSVKSEKKIGGYKKDGEYSKFFGINESSFALKGGVYDHVYAASIGQQYERDPDLGYDGFRQRKEIEVERYNDFGNCFVKNRVKIKPWQ